MADDKVVKGGDVEFAESAMRPDAALEETVAGASEASPQSATGSFVGTVLRRYLADVANYLHGFSQPNYDPKEASHFIPYLAFDSLLRVALKPVTKPILVNILRTMPNIAQLLDLTDIEEALPDSYEVLKGDPVVDSLGYRPQNHANEGFVPLRRATEVRLIVPTSFLPLVIAEGEKYETLLSKTTDQAIYVSIVRNDNNPLIPSQFAALGLTPENLMQLVNEEGGQNVSGMIKDLRLFHETVEKHGCDSTKIANEVYQRLKQYHPELTV